MVKQSISGGDPHAGDDKGDIVIFQSTGDAPSLEVRLGKRIHLA